MEITIGRRGDQPFAIEDRAVSGRHLKLTTLPDGNIQVEDLGSSNGTFIDDVRVIKKTVSRDTVVRMGPTYTFCIKDVIPEVTRRQAPTPHITPSQEQTPNTAPQMDLETMRKFKQLESIWNKYQQDKIDLQKANASKGYIRMLPMFILAGLGYLISCIPSLADFRVGITLAGLGLGIIITWISYKSTTNLPEQMEKLNQQFQIDYVCPKCKQFLGFTPFEGLKNRGKCSYCRSQWV